MGGRSQPIVVVAEPFQTRPRSSRTHHHTGMRRLNGDKRTGRAQVDPHDHFDSVHSTQIPAIVHVDDSDVVADLADVSSWMLRVGAFHLNAECARCRIIRRDVFVPVPSELVTNVPRVAPSHSPASRPPDRKGGPSPLPSDTAVRCRGSR